MSRRRQLPDSFVVVTLLAVITVAAAIALFPTVEQPTVTFNVQQPSPYGYTLSLALFLLPTLVLLDWLWRHPDLKIQRKAVGISLSIILPIWCLLDVFLGNTFFTFPNAGATLQVYFWGYSFDTGWARDIPIEEFGFYITGISAILLSYVWASESWLSAYAVDEKKRLEAGGGRLLHPKWSALVIGVGLFALGLVLKKVGPHPYHEGFPGYFGFLLLSSIVPSVMFLRVVRPFLHWRALTFTLMGLLLISLLWEVTLALPQGWWNYKPDMMLGMMIRAWHGLPIEEPMLWMAAAWINVICYEVVRLLLTAGRPLRDLFRLKD